MQARLTHVGIDADHVLPPSANAVPMAAVTLD